MKRRKNLNELDNKIFESIDIVFENCEVFTVPAIGVERAHFGDLTCNLSLHYNGEKYASKKGELMSMVYTDFASIVLNRRGRKVLGGFDGKDTLENRLKHNDITHIDVNFTDNTHLYIGTPWGGDDDYYNAAMHVFKGDYLLEILLDEKADVKVFKENFEEYEDFYKPMTKKELEEEDEEIETGDDEELKDDNKEVEPTETPSPENKDEESETGILPESEGFHELGHIIFGTNKIYSSKVPACVEAALTMLKGKLSVYMLNNRLGYGESPFENSGEKFKNDTFEVQAYDWDEESGQTYNFKWKDYELSWYKYLGRDMSANREMAPEECNEMLTDCLNSLKKEDD